MISSNCTNLLLLERESAFTSLIRMRARNTHSSKAESWGETEDEKDREEEGENRANGRLQVQPVYIARTTDSRRSMADVGARARARCRVHDRQGEAHQFPIQFADAPVFRTLARPP